MKIGFDAKRAFVNHSGLGNYCRSLISLMASHYPENEYLLYTSESNHELFIGGSKMQLRTPSGSVAKLFPSAWRTLGMSHALKSDKPDIFHGLSNELPRGIQHTGVRSVVTIHDLIFLQKPELYPFVDRQMYRAKFAYACRNAGMVIAVSEATRQDILGNYSISPAKVKVAYQSCNPDFLEKADTGLLDAVRQKYSLPDEFILSVGTLEKRKNALSILKAVHRYGLEIPIVLAGWPTSYLKEIREYSDQNHMNKQLILLQRVETSELPGLYQLASVFVYPSLIEGFGIPILEALSSGTPVITSRGGCFPETGGDAALYVNPEDPEELGESIKKVLADSALQTSMIKLGYAHAELFSGRHTTSKLMELYHELVQSA